MTQKPRVRRGTTRKPREVGDGVDRHPVTGEERPARDVPAGFARLGDTFADPPLAGELIDERADRLRAVVVDAARREIEDRLVRDEQITSDEAASKRARIEGQLVQLAGPWSDAARAARRRVLRAREAVDVALRELSEAIAHPFDGAPSTVVAPVLGAWRAAAPLLPTSDPDDEIAARERLAQALESSTLRWWLHPPKARDLALASLLAGNFPREARFEMTPAAIIRLEANAFHTRAARRRAAPTSRRR